MAYCDEFAGGEILSLSLGGSRIKHIGLAATGHLHPTPQLGPVRRLIEPGEVVTPDLAADI